MNVHDPHLEQFDARVAEAVHDVPVPEGLAERLQAELEADAMRSAADDSAVHEGDSPSFLRSGEGDSPNFLRGLRKFATVPKLGTVPGRRTWLASTAVGAVACAASVLAAMWLWPRSSDEVGVEDVMHLARAWHQQGDGAAKDWNFDTAPPRDYPFGSQVLAIDGAPWRQLADRFFGRRGVQYRLTGPRNVRATLLVIDRRGSAAAPQLAALSSSPLHSALTTDGCTTAAWVEGSRLYVLVVDGDLRAFRSFVRQLGSMA